MKQYVLPIEKVKIITRIHLLEVRTSVVEVNIIEEEEVDKIQIKGTNRIFFAQDVEEKGMKLINAIHHRIR